MENAEGRQGLGPMSIVGGIKDGHMLKNKESVGWFGKQLKSQNLLCR
jgi:hypothetical protein